MSTESENLKEQPNLKQEMTKNHDKESNLNIEAVKSSEKNVPKEVKNVPEDYTHCPICKTPLQKFLIQQNYSLVMCPKEDCNYPFDQEQNIDNISYIDEKEMLEVAQQRLSLNPE
ncbi:similar to Saccharomyces cerevisiae YNL162W-A Putative protein of unknown function [Maudiozyma saulgeensis]|uniref:Uncharacterized protein n=1 Tax=Maudiozyma saulgeensis TaxID=1789683 RepID=A0A1X7R2C1_9SACH|nr:similar to Saccharomyces cerevisiae YNL162W-A Putative protein of unknown function [Kazachstania saulgeensis]